MTAKQLELGKYYLAEPSTTGIFSVIKVIEKKPKAKWVHFEIIAKDEYKTQETKDHVKSKIVNYREVTVDLTKDSNVILLNAINQAIKQLEG